MASLSPPVKKGLRKSLALPSKQCNTRINTTATQAFSGQHIVVQLIVAQWSNHLLSGTHTVHKTPTGVLVVAVTDMREATTTIATATFYGGNMMFPFKRQVLGPAAFLLYY
jgi:hypothetical protein